MFVAEGQTQLERIASLTHYPIPQELDRPSASVRLSHLLFGRQQQTFGAGTRSMAFRRRVWQAVGGFPERQYAGEDQAFARSAIDSGFTAAFARDAVVHWRPPGNWSANARMFYRYCRGDIRSRGRSRHLLRLLAWTVGPAAAFRGRREARALVAAGAAAYISLPLRRARVARLDRGYWWRIPIAVAVKDISQIAGAAHGTVDALRGVPQPTPQPPAPMAGERSSTALSAPTSVAEQRAVEHAIRVHSQQAGRFANWYEAPHVTASGTCFAFSRRRLQDRLTEYLPPPGTRAAVLDVGCGTGEQMAHLRSLGFHVTGVDGSPEMLEYARSRNPDATLIRAHVDDLPFDSAQFDLVVCIEVLRYLPDPQPCINEMARVLRPGGLCLATAIPYANLNGYAIVNRVASTLMVPGLTSLRQYFTTAARLDRQFAMAGFDRRRVHGIYFGPINWIQRTRPESLESFLRAWEPIDQWLSRRPRLRNLANMQLIAATRAG